MHRHIPNSLTIVRLILAIVFFALLSTFQYGGPNGRPVALLITAMVVFIVAVLTDALDGYLARRWQAITLFGRVMDPVVDKVLVVGAFIFLAGPQFVDPDDPTRNVTGFYPWMAVLVLVREFLVTSIRATLESARIEFAALGAGKAKMILQSVAVPVLLLMVMLDGRGHAWVHPLRAATVWAVVIVTILSGLPYITGAIKAVRHAHGQAH